MKGQEMRHKRIVLLLLAFGLVGCGAKEDIEESVVESTVEETVESETETETVETEEAKEEGAKTFLTLQEGENNFTDAVKTAFGDSLEEGDSFAYYETDLDLDGKKEAIVLYGYPDEIQTDKEDKPTMWYSSKVWFVGENYDVDEVFSYWNSTSEYFVEQQCQQIGDKAYFVLNGKESIDSLGVVCTVEDDALVDPLDGAWDRGQKVIEGDQLIWYSEFYGQSFRIDKDLTIRNWDRSGRVFMPYTLYLEDGKFKLYEAHEVTREEAEDVAKLAPLSYEREAVAVQYLLRDNGELEINYVQEEGDTYEFAAEVYTLSEDGKEWQLANSLPGYFTDNGDVFGEHWKLFKLKYGEPYVFHHYSELELKAMTPQQLFDAFVVGDIQAEAKNEDGSIYHYDAVYWDFDAVDANNAAYVRDPVDIDNDGEPEFVITGGMYGDNYYDCKDGKVVEITGGKDTTSVCSYVMHEGVCWVVHKDTTHAGRCGYWFDRYNGDLQIVESFSLKWEEDEDGTNHYYYNDEEVTEDEYNKIETEYLG